MNSSASRWCSADLVSAFSARPACSSLSADFSAGVVKYGDVIEGVQGRYFLPVLPLALMSIHVRRIPRLPMSAVIAAGILANIIALGVLARQYWW